MPARREVVRPVAAALIAATAFAAAPVDAAPAAAGAFPVPDPSGCRGNVYLTLDTGSMRHAQVIADILGKHRVRATFFVANEATDGGSGSLEPAWDGYWRARVAEGHGFGSHTYDHVYFTAAAAIAGASPGDGARVGARPQFGASAGRLQRWSAADVCREIARADDRFRAATGRPLERIWRAPGGRGPEALFGMAAACGWRHVGWSPNGFLGDELPSDRFPNDALLAQSLQRIRDGDILMAHLGIRSRQDPYAPTLDPLIAGLRARGLCFRTLAEHPLAGAPAVRGLPVPSPAKARTPAETPALRRP